MARNTFKTFVLLAGLAGLAVAIGRAFGPGGATIGLVLGLVMVGGSYWFSHRIALLSARARIVEEHEAPELHAMIRRLALAWDMPMPAVAVSPALQPNAFATGRSPSHAVVCVTEGLMQAMPRDELEGVLAHELAHVRNNDILIGSVAAAIATGISYVAQMAMFSAWFGGGDEDAPNPLALLLIAVLAPVAATILQLAVSRSREFEADRSGAELLGNGDSLARALERIEAHARAIPLPVQPAQASAWIHSPLAGAQAGRGVRFASLFMTHPPTAERVARLRAMRSRALR
jgi:heat shock protein HtpX